MPFSGSSVEATRTRPCFAAPTTEVKPPKCHCTPSSCPFPANLPRTQPNQQKHNQRVFECHLEYDYYISVATYPCERNLELIRIKCGLNLDSQSGLTHACKRGISVFLRVFLKVYNVLCSSSTLIHHNCTGPVIVPFSYLKFKVVIILSCFTNRCS